jgi:hypothetical protein
MFNKRLKKELEKRTTLYLTDYKTGYLVEHNVAQVLTILLTHLDLDVTLIERQMVLSSRTANRKKYFKKS